MLAQPHCKINIGLHVTERRADGYHLLETVFYPVPLRDNLEITVRHDRCEPNEVPYRLTEGGFPIAGNPEDNLVVRVYLALRREFDLPPVDIDLQKLIPMGAGLGGGSSDAAFMMTALNELFDLGLSESDMKQRVAAFGADCPYFVGRGPAYATGIGDVLAPLALSLKGKHIVLVKPDIFISTKEAYAGVTPKASDVDLRKAVQLPVSTWRDTVVNDFEASVFPSRPLLPAIKQTLYDMGAEYASMSGSGSTIFGLFSRPVPECKAVFKDCFVFTKQLSL